VDTFEVRVARLEEQIVKPDPPTAEECLDRAEDYFARGQLEFAEFWLDTAKWTSRQADRRISLDEVEKLLDELDQEGPAARLEARRPSGPKGNQGCMFTYLLHLEDGSDAGEATYSVQIRPGEEILVGNGRRFRVLDVVPSGDEEEMSFVGMLKIEAAKAI
jgi:hypothetical protein